MYRAFEIADFFGFKVSKGHHRSCVWTTAMHRACVCTEIRDMRIFALGASVADIAVELGPSRHVVFWVNQRRAADTADICRIFSDILLSAPATS